MSMLSPQFPVIHGLHVLKPITGRALTNTLHAICTVTIQEYNQNSMEFDVHVVYAYKLRNKSAGIYNKQCVFLYMCKRGKSLQWIY
jgi:hypothetical protein